MTDEEMADKYAEKVVRHKMAVHDIFNEIVTKKEIKEAVMYGLKAGRPKWHKVADGDLPPCEKGNYTINILTDKGDIAYYSYTYDCWITEPSSGEIDPPIAWCEIPKYTEE